MSTLKSTNQVHEGKSDIGKTSRLVIIVVLIVFAVTLGAFIYTAGQKPTLYLNCGQLDSIRPNNAIAGFIIEK